MKNTDEYDAVFSFLEVSWVCFTIQPTEEPSFSGLGGRGGGGGERISNGRGDFMRGNLYE